MCLCVCVYMCVYVCVYACACVCVGGGCCVCVRACDLKRLTMHYRAYKDVELGAMFLQSQVSLFLLFFVSNETYS